MNLVSARAMTRQTARNARKNCGLTNPAAAQSDDTAAKQSVRKSYHLTNLAAEQNTCKFFRLPLYTQEGVAKCSWDTSSGIWPNGHIR